MKKKLPPLLLLIFYSQFSLLQAQSISAGHDYSLFLCNTNTAMACGMNSFGELGDGTTTTTYTNPPIPVSSLNGLTSISAGGFHSLFLKYDGTVWVCGQNFNGQLGDGTNTERHLPVQANITNVKEVAAGWYHSIFLKTDGTVWACGRNDFGQLGDGTNIDRATPIQITSLSGIKKIAVGEFHSIFLKTNGTVWACGNNGDGQLGDGTTVDKNIPVQITALNGISGVAAIAAGRYHSVYLKTTGDVWACGNNIAGQLGDGTIANDSVPVQVAGISNITDVAAGDYHSLYLKNDSTVWGCGANWNHQLGDGTAISTLTGPAVQVLLLTGITDISACFLHSLFLKNDGTAWACGHNVYGELGDGTVGSSAYPVQVGLGACTISSAGVEENNAKNNISIYPNPTSNDYFYIDLINIELVTQIEIYDLEGRKKLSLVPSSSEVIPVNVSGFSKGIYVVRINSSKGIVHKKVVVE